MHINDMVATGAGCRLLMVGVVIVCLWGVVWWAIG
jgi:hypothetical protein